MLIDPSAETVRPHLPELPLTAAGALLCGDELPKAGEELTGLTVDEALFGLPADGAMEVPLI